MELQQKPFSFLSLQIASCNLLRLRLLDGNSRELTNPELGRDFVAGTLEDNRSVGVFRQGVLSSLQFVSESELVSDAMKFTRIGIGELLTNRAFPALANIYYLESGKSVQRIRLIGVTRGFLFTDSYQNLAIPIAALGVIEVGCE
jgi:hypothetical protein